MATIRSSFAERDLQLKAHPVHLQLKAPPVHLRHIVSGEDAQDVPYLYRSFSAKEPCN